MTMNEEELEMNMDDDFDGDDDLENNSDSRGGIMQSTSKRVRMIFSVMASPTELIFLEF